MFTFDRVISVLCLLVKCIVAEVIRKRRKESGSIIRTEMYVSLCSLFVFFFDCEFLFRSFILILFFGWKIVQARPRDKTKGRGTPRVPAPPSPPRKDKFDDDEKIKIEIDESLFR